MSDPIGSAISVSASRDNFASKSSLSASNTEAASLLPPPSPAPCGIFLLSSMEIAGSILVASKNAFAARTARLSSSCGTDGSSQRSLIPFPGGSFSILSSSYNEIGAMIVSSSWKPSSRRPRIFSDRLIFAGAKTCISSCERSRAVPAFQPKVMSRESSTSWE